MVTPQQAEQFRSEGYFVLERAVSDQDLERLRNECQRSVAEKDAAMARAGTATEGISHRGSRYFAKNGHERSSFFLFGPTMEDIVRSLLGDDVYLFFELFVVKYPHGGMEFGWHQDSGYMRGRPHKPYLTCWCPLDDVTIGNGTLWLLPFTRVDSRETLPHVRDEVTNDLIGYEGHEEGIPVEVPAGSIVAFSSRLLHRTGVNRSARQRRAYLAEYSSEPIVDYDGSLWNMAVPFIRHGRRVSEP